MPFPIKIHWARLVKSATSPGQYPSSARPEIAFVGRSNVGKSSLINSITRSKKLAVTSHTPGRTRLINFFDVNGRIVLVDLPGYGYARASKAERARWQDMVETYLTRRDVLSGVVVIVDVRHDASPLDRQMIEYLASHEIPTMVVLTKADKLSRSRLASHVRRIEKGLELPSESAIPFSARTGLGIDELWSTISQVADLPLKRLSRPG